jgi:23S rRNA (cytosine1962-C5)-methyltransferase
MTWSQAILLCLIASKVYFLIVNGLLVLSSNTVARSKLHISRNALFSTMSPSLSPSSQNITHEHNDLLGSPFHPLERAIRNSVVDEKEATRLFHGRGGLFEGCEHITLDWFPPVWLLTSHHTQISPSELGKIQDMLVKRCMIEDRYGSSAINLVYQHRSTNASATSQVLSGCVPAIHVVMENGMKFSISLLQGQNQGIFLDMRNGREWIRRNSHGKRVLNLFAYTCGFSIAALMGGATEVINMDMASGCLKVGQRNHVLNDLPTLGVPRFFAHDIFKSWGKIRKLGLYGLIVVDPPSFQKGSFVAKADYHKILRRIPGLLEPDGWVMLCLNAPELDSTWLRDEVTKAAPELEFVKRLQNPSAFPAKDHERALKILIYKSRM